MLLIELISISNMGVSLIETCFCSQLYGKLILILPHKNILHEMKRLFTTIGFLMQKTWLPVVAIISFD